MGTFFDVYSKTKANRHAKRVFTVSQLNTEKVAVALDVTYFLLKSFLDQMFLIPLTCFH
jgi:hypothetical protein